jgi:ABC-type antimicrobial peptide transport system permease subunit
VASLAHALLTSVLRRRRDLAVFKALGFSRRQLHGTVAMQATTMALIALVIGLPLGTAAGRLAWRFLAADLGVPPRPVLPVVTLALAALAVLACVNAVALLPGRTAARTRVAEVLRTE